MDFSEWRGDLRPLRLAVGYLVQLSAGREQRSSGSLGTAVAMTRKHLLAARRHVYVDDAPVDRLGVGFLGMAPELVQCVEDRQHTSPGMVLLELAAGLLPVELEIHPVAVSRPLIGKRWVSVGFPKSFSSRNMTVVKGTLSTLPRPLEDTTQIDLECDEEQSVKRLRELEGAPLYIEEVGAPWILSGFLRRPVSKEAPKKTALSANLPLVKTDHLASDSSDNLLRELQIYGRRPLYQAFDDYRRAQFEIEVLWEGLNLQRGYPTREDLRRQLRSARRSGLGRPARPMSSFSSREEPERRRQPNALEKGPSHDVEE